MTILTPTIEAIRTKGQVWTPSWVADAMAIILHSKLAGEILDPAVGPGALVAACKRISDADLKVTAYEIDESVLALDHSETEFAKSDYSKIVINSFLEDSDDKKYSAIIANPPYLRHHKIPAHLKSRCREITQNVLGIDIDARAGLHIYFLIQALSRLEENGKLVFLVPADTFEGVFAEKLWTAIAAKFRIDGVLTMSSEVSAFPGVDTNAVIISISNSDPVEEMIWAKWQGAKPIDFSKAVELAFSSNLIEASKLGLNCAFVPIEEAISRGFTRSQSGERVEGVPFVDIARAMRGIATGDNEFFVFTKKRIQEFGLKEENFVRTIMRVRDLPSSRLSIEDLENLDDNDRPTYLLSIDANTVLYPKLQEYIRTGEATGLNKKALVSARKCWYFMEKREPVPILFAYLGRRNVRFTIVDVAIQPLTGFLCVYPLNNVTAEALVTALNHPSTINELSKVGKSYGDGAIKVEPGGLRKLIVPWEAIEAAGIKTTDL
jgi:adenine-specific DNA-methyltransferase